MNVRQQATLTGAFLLVALVLTTSVSLAQKSTVTISTGEWGPFVSESLPGYGIAPTIVDAAFSKVGIEVEYVFFPWARAMKLAEDGEVDFSGFWFNTAERATRFQYTGKIVDSPNVFFYRKDRPFDWESYENFPEDAVVGTTLSYSYSQDFDTAVERGKINVEVEEADILNMRKVLRGRIDAFPIAELVGYDLIRESFSPAEASMLIAHPKEISSAPLHLIAGKSTPKSLIDQFNRGLELLAESGELERILDQYK